jgi:hypothetical protein
MSITLNNMYKQNGGPVTISSVLTGIPSTKPETVDAIRNAAILAAVNKAYELWGGAQSLTVRDLNGSDMSYTNNIMTETSNATTNQWNGMAFGAFTVATATVIAIYGVSLGWIEDGTIDECPITGVRIEVGGSRHAQWNVQCLDQHNSAASTAPLIPIAGVTRSPIIVAEDITVTIYEYTRRASVAYDPVWLGVAVEKQGVTLKP